MITELPVPESLPFRVTITSGTVPTGGWYFGVTTVGGCFSYPPQLQVTEDERMNPKFWARWFREFLFELFSDRKPAIKGRDSVTRRAVSQRARGSTLSTHEWVFKDWCQALKAE